MNVTTAIATRDPWSVVPSLGNLDAYIRSVQTMPMLEADEEQALARRLRDQQDLQAASKLVLSHLRLVVSISRQYMGYGLPQGDLIQEGNVGLMKAVKRFDPDQGVRLVSYAMHWIKAEIHEYILKNWRMVKVATTKAQRKLFFNLRSLKHQYKHDADDAHVGRAGLSEADIHRVAAELNVRPEDVIEMETRMAGGDVALEASADDDHEGPIAPLAYLADDVHEPTRVIEAHRRDWLASDGIAHALDQLDERSRRIVEERWLKVNDNGSGGMTLHELAADYGVSAERIRQIEVAAMKKMRKALTETIDA
jgi:RNA polymerase sigma-32 factor